MSLLSWINLAAFGLAAIGATGAGRAGSLDRLQARKASREYDVATARAPLEACLAQKLVFVKTTTHEVHRTEIVFGAGSMMMTLIDTPPGTHIEVRTLVLRPSFQKIVDGCVASAALKPTAFVKADPNTVSVSKDGHDSWTFDEVKDAMTDAPRGIAIGHGTGGELIVKCDAPGKGMYIAFLSDTYLGGDGIKYGIRDFAVRFDDEPAHVTLFKYDGKNAWSFKASDAAQITASLMTANRVRIRAITYQHKMVDGDFTTTGAAAAITKARSSCHA